MSEWADALCGMGVHLKTWKVNSQGYTAWQCLRCNKHSRWKYDHKMAMRVKDRQRYEAHVEMERRAHEAE